MAAQTGKRFDFLVLIALTFVCASVAAEPTSGAAVYRENCAVCHGEDARGGGIFTSVLRVTPPDLTKLAQANNGTFPEQFVLKTLAGIDMPGAHGNRDMPIWGRHWRQDGAGSAGARARMIAVAAYLRTIQD